MKFPMHAPVRAFVAVSLDAGLKASIHQLQDQLQDSCGIHVVRWANPDQLHLTLKFFGTVPSDRLTELSDALGASCHGITAFRLAIGGLGCFPSIQRPSVIWIEVRGDVGVLETLQKRIDRATTGFGSHSESREFHPHLTLGRVKTAGREARQAGLAIQNTQVGELGRWNVHEVELIQSTLSPQGSSYRQLACVSLAAH